MCSIGSSEGPSLSMETHPKAIKKHVCCECGSTIDIGEIYQRVEGVWGGTWETYKTCYFCDYYREEAAHEFNYRYDESIPFGELWECVGMDYAGQ